MGKITGFKEFSRIDRTYQIVDQRINNFDEFVIPLDNDELNRQSARCMDCGIPFCHTGCPVNNLIPDWNDLVYKEDFKSALVALHSTNNFPEITGRICPAPCQESCTLNITDEPVTIKTIECAIVDRGFEEGWIKPERVTKNTGKKIAIVGSGPAGMAAAQQLVRVGHDVVLYEKEPKAGGLVRFGIPDFKLAKDVVERRVQQLVEEGVDLQLNTHIGVDVTAKQLIADNDAVILTGGAEKPRDLAIEGRDLGGVMFAMDFLKSNSKVVQGLLPESTRISAKDKHVVVIGGGDTGSDCIGTSSRHGAASITQIEIMPRPPEKEDKALVWPEWPNKMRTSTSQEEGCKRLFAVATKRFIADSKGQLAAVICVKVEWNQEDSGRWQMTEVAGSEFELKADIVTLAMGFVHPVQEGMLNELGVEYDAMGNVKGSTEGDKAYYTSLDKVFAAGDMRRGQSLVVWAIREGRQCAHAVDHYLMNETSLPR
ncbi:MAG: glutamate synthase subunit beta [Thiotrichaceae bacterium]|nr:glutamate synthase subunit beta [Thiotrichaceae bacterium]